MRFGRSTTLEHEAATLENGTFSVITTRRTTEYEMFELCWNCGAPTTLRRFDLFGFGICADCVEAYQGEARRSR